MIGRSKMLKKPINEDFRNKVIVITIGEDNSSHSYGRYYVRYEIKGDRKKGSYAIYFDEKLKPLKRYWSTERMFGVQSIEHFIRPKGKDRPTAKREVATIFDIVRDKFPII